MRLPAPRLCFGQRFAVTNRGRLRRPLTPGARRPSPPGTRGEPEPIGDGRSSASGMAPALCSVHEAATLPSLPLPAFPAATDGRVTSPSDALVAQGIEHRPPEPGAQVRILPGAPTRQDANLRVRSAWRARPRLSALACFREDLVDGHPQELPRAMIPPAPQRPPRGRRPPVPDLPCVTRASPRAQDRRGLRPHALDATVFAEESRE